MMEKNEDQLGFYHESNSIVVCTLVKVHAMPRNRTPDDTEGVVASGTSILHRFASSHAIVRAFYVPLTNIQPCPQIDKFTKIGQIPI
jgi:hypothetical protein